MNGDSTDIDDNPTSDTPGRPLYVWLSIWAGIQAAVTLLLLPSLGVPVSLAWGLVVSFVGTRVILLGLDSHQEASAARHTLDGESR